MTTCAVLHRYVQALPDVCEKVGETQVCRLHIVVSDHQYWLIMPLKLWESFWDLFSGSKITV